MKKSKDYTLLAIAIVLLMALIGSGAFSCKPQDKAVHEESCPYEAGECPNDDCRNHTFEYRFDLEPDSIIVYDGSRFVGKVPIRWENPSPLDSLLLKDNQ